MTRVVFGSRCVENVLSNFCPSPLEFEGLIFTCPESLFQGIKALYSDEPKRLKILQRWIVMLQESWESSQGFGYFHVEQCQCQCYENDS